MMVMIVMTVLALTPLHTTLLESRQGHHEAGLLHGIWDLGVMNVKNREDDFDNDDENDAFDYDTHDDDDEDDDVVVLAVKYETGKATRPRPTIPVTLSLSQSLSHSLPPLYLTLYLSHFYSL